MQETSSLLPSIDACISRNNRRNICKNLSQTIYAFIYTGVLALGDIYILRKLVSSFVNAEEADKYNALINVFGFIIGCIVRSKHGLIMLDSLRESNEHAQNLIKSILKILIVAMPAISLALDGFFDLELPIPFVVEFIVGLVLGVGIIYGELKYYQAELISPAQFFKEIKDFCLAPGHWHRALLFGYVSLGTLASNLLTNNWSESELIYRILQKFQVQDERTLNYTSSITGWSLASLGLTLDFFKENLSVKNYYLEANAKETISIKKSSARKKCINISLKIKLFIAITAFWESLPVFLAVYSDLPKSNVLATVSINVLIFFSFIIPNLISTNATAEGSVAKALNGNLFSFNCRQQEKNASVQQLAEESMVSDLEASTASGYYTT